MDILKNKLEAENKYGNICLWLFIITSFYYPIGASFISIFNLPSTSVNVLIRSIFTLVALYLIGTWLNFRHREKNIPFSVFMLLIFWFLYSIRILYDLNNGVKFGDYNNSYIYGYTFGNIFVPIIAIICWGKFIKFERLPKIFFYFFLISNLSILIVIIIQTGGFDPALFLSRADLRSENSGEVGDALVLNPILIGTHGELFAVTSLYNLLFEKNKIQFKFFLILSIILGIVLILLGASRGPFLYFLICLIFFITKILVNSKYRVRTLLKILFFLFIIILIFINTIGKFFKIEDFYLFDRLSTFFEERQNNIEEYRDIQIAYAWKDFLDSPIIGKQFVGTYDNFYPHNFFLELLMATGIVGLFIFGAFFNKIVIIYLKIFSIKQPYNFFVIILFLPLLLGNLSSGSLFMGIEFWLYATVIIVNQHKFINVK